VNNDYLYYSEKPAGVRQIHLLQFIGNMGHRPPGGSQRGCKKILGLSAEIDVGGKFIMGTVTASGTVNMKQA
jgi:hypothetical protein